MTNQKKRIPKVSVCIPTYNRAHFVARAIKSVLRQDYRDFELIICDDASTDNTEETVKKYKNPRIRYVRNNVNIGQWKNCNKCIDLSRGEYIIFPGDDDILMQGLLRKEITLMNRFPNVGFVAPEFYLVDNNENILPRKSSFINSSYIIVPGRQFLEYFMLGQPVFGSHSIVWVWPSVMVRKKLVLDVGKFNLDLDTTLADGWILYRLSLISDFAQICEPLFKF